MKTESVPPMPKIGGGSTLPKPPPTDPVQIGPSKLEKDIADQNSLERMMSIKGKGVDVNL